MKNALRPIACLMILTTLLLAAPARGQSQIDLRRENERLEAKVASLQRELDAAQAEVRSLRAELERLRQLVARSGAGTATARQPGAAPTPGTGPTTPGAPPAVTIDESKPDASPRALFRAIVSDYQEMTADHEPGAESGDPDRIAYLRLLDRWSARANRKFRAPIKWHVRIVAAPVTVARGYRLHMEAVDPETGATVGDPFDTLISRALAKRLKQIEQRIGLDDVMVLRGTLVPEVRVNEARTDTGPFDNPRFIGPFAEFQFAVVADSLLPPPDEDEKEAARRRSERRGASGAGSNSGAKTASGDGS
jgi:hypothetical protein